MGAAGIGPGESGNQLAGRELDAEPGIGGGMGGGEMRVDGEVGTMGGGGMWKGVMVVCCCWWGWG